MFRSARRLPAIERPDVVPMPDRSGMLASLEAVRSEIREISDEYVDAVLQLITERALSLTGASGAALALLTDDKMICRARAGEPVPPLGAPVDAQRGLSGECIRTGLIVSCQDMENDRRMDPDVGRTLGVGSVMAAPIVSDFGVVGLLEIFSPHPCGFTDAHETVLNRLVEMIPKTRREWTQPENTQPEKTQPETPVGPEAVSRPPASELGLMKSRSIESGSIYATRDALWVQEPEVSEQGLQQVPGQVLSKRVPEQVPEPVPGPGPTALSNLFHWALLGLVAAVVAMAVGYLIGSMIATR